MKRTLLPLILLLACNAVRAQTFFFRAGAAYALPLSNSQPVYLTGFPYTGGNASPADAGMLEVKKASMFSGARVFAGAGIMFSRIGFELAAASVLSNVSYNFSGSLGGIYPPGSMTSVTQSAKNPLMLIPSLVMKVPGRKLDIFLRAGLVLPLNKKIYIESETIDSGNRYTDKSELRTSFSAGFAFSGGVEYKVTKNLYILAGIDIITMTAKALELNLLESKNNGTDVFSTKFAYERQTRYVDDLSAYSFSSDKPRQSQSYSVPFGSKGISLGIVYGL